MITQKSSDSQSKLKIKIESDSKKPYQFIIYTNKDELIFSLETLKDFPVKIYELITSIEKLKEKDDNFNFFKTPEIIINKIKTCINSKNYGLSYNEDKNTVIFIMKNELFDNGIAKIEVPEKKQDINIKVDSLTKVVSDLRGQLITSKDIPQKEKDEAAINSFNGTSFLNNDEKKLITSWIHPKKLSNLIYFSVLIKMELLVQLFIIIVMVYFQLLWLS